MLRDEPGVLSAVLNSFAVSGGNILTINQGIPISGCALVTIGAETSGLEIPVEELVSRTSRLTGSPAVRDPGGTIIHTTR